MLSDPPFHFLNIMTSFLKSFGVIILTNVTIKAMNVMEFMLETHTCHLYQWKPQFPGTIFLIIPEMTCPI